MDNLDNKPSVQPDQIDLQAQYDTLRHLVVSILVLVVVISGTLTFCFWRQWLWVKRDLAAVRPQATPMIIEFQKDSGPRMQEFVKKITEYGRTHPDFVPVLAKYGFKPVTPTNSSPTTPAPTAPKK
jgi:hypothetical protein